MTDITGVADMTEKRGLRNARKRRSKPAAMPAAIPSGTAIKIPPNTRIKLLPKAVMNRRVETRLMKLLNTGKGPGRIRPELKNPEAISQRRMKNTMPAKV